MQRLTEHHLFEHEDTFGILFQFLYFFFSGLLHVCIIKNTSCT